jgi:hypothetical protein
MLSSDWSRIEREAREQVVAAVQADEVTPMALGTSIAWAECRFGRTNDLSLVHRVGESRFDEQWALCGERIPPAILRVALSPNLVLSLGRCRYCDAEHQKIQRANTPLAGAAA